MYDAADAPGQGLIGNGQGGGEHFQRRAALQTRLVFEAGPAIGSDEQEAADPAAVFRPALDHDPPLVAIDIEVADVDPIGGRDISSRARQAGGTAGGQRRAPDSNRALPAARQAPAPLQLGGAERAGEDAVSARVEPKSLVRAGRAPARSFQAVEGDKGAERCGQRDHCEQVENEHFDTCVSQARLAGEKSKLRTGRRGVKVST